MDGKKPDAARSGPEIVTDARQSADGPPVTFCVPVYNEEARIANVLAHAVCWADEVLVVNKSSTDRTEEIARAYGPKVRVITVPFSPQGQDTADEWFEHASYDWIFLGTCSEVPTRRLISEVRDLLFRSGDCFDLILVPRRMYSLGMHHPNSPWSVSYYPFLVHRRRALITNVIHEHFKAADPSRMTTIAYTEECCVYHFTHPSARRFIETHAEYARVETAVERDPDQVILASFKSIHEQLPGIFRTGSHWPAIFSAWSLYNLMNVLLIWEKARGLDVGRYYQTMREKVLEREWGVLAGGTGSAPTTGSPAGRESLLPEERTLQASLQKTVFLAYAVANTIYHLQNPRAIPGSLRHWAGCQKLRISRWIKG